MCAASLDAAETSFRPRYRFPAPALFCGFGDSFAYVVHCAFYFGVYEFIRIYIAGMVGKFPIHILRSGTFDNLRIFTCRARFSDESVCNSLRHIRNPKRFLRAELRRSLASFCRTFSKRAEHDFTTRLRVSVNSYCGTDKSVEFFQLFGVVRVL